MLKRVIEEFVEKIIVHKDYFEWKLNFMNETIKLEINGTSKIVNNVIFCDIIFLMNYFF